MRKVVSLLALALTAVGHVYGMTPVEIKREYGDAVVTITTYSAAEDAVGLGSGFIVDPSGVIVTCYHVINGAYPAVVKLLNGASFQDIYVLGCDPVKDVAVIKVKGRGLPSVRLGDSESAEVGERVVVIGNPKGLENTVSDGLLSGVRELEGYNLLQISAPISPGSSGGPVFNSSGRVIGIAAATLRDGQNLNFCVPIRYARQHADGKPSLTLKDFSRGVRVPATPPASTRVPKTDRGLSQPAVATVQTWRDTLAQGLFSNDSVLYLQKALKRLGYDPGPMDGCYGPSTKAAIVAYLEEGGTPPAHSLAGRETRVCIAGDILGLP